MIRAMALACLLCSCGAHVPPQFRSCPDPVPVPAALRKGESIGKLEIRVELAREDERARADACAEAVIERDNWIKVIRP